MGQYLDFIFEILSQGKSEKIQIQVIDSTLSHGKMTAHLLSARP